VAACSNLGRDLPGLVVLAGTLLGAVPAVPLVGSFAAQAVITLAVFGATVGVPLPVLGPLGVVALAVGFRRADAGDDRRPVGEIEPAARPGCAQIPPPFKIRRREQRSSEASRLALPTSGSISKHSSYGEMHRLQAVGSNNGYCNSVRRS
jgi:hypothetical protein